ncbi:MAG: hypothetical protein MK035_06020, partial [Dehalococcoidia bacterium]|nr:hypothetical protein [Dehalococcoidia bacterium]
FWIRFLFLVDIFWPNSGLPANTAKSPPITSTVRGLRKSYLQGTSLFAYFIISGSRSAPEDFCRSLSSFFVSLAVLRLTTTFPHLYRIFKNLSDLSPPLTFSNHLL